MYKNASWKGSKNVSNILVLDWNEMKWNDEMKYSVLETPWLQLLPGYQSGSASPAFLGGIALL